MNVIGIVIGILFLICVLVGWMQGLFKVAISVLGLVVSIILSTYVSPHVSGWIEDYTQIDEKIAEYMETELGFKETEKKVSKGKQVKIIHELPLPNSIKTNLLDHNNSEMYEALNVENIFGYITKTIAMVIINATVFLILTLAARIVFCFVSTGIKGLTKLPILRWMDKIGGGCLGLVKALVFTWIFFLFLSVTSMFSGEGSWSNEAITEINYSIPLKFLYEHNMLLEVVEDLTKVLFL